MVKKVIVIACLAASLLIFLTTIDFVHGLIMFLMAGIIPGTSIILSGTQMLIIIAILSGLAVYQFGVRLTLYRLSQHPVSSKKEKVTKTTKRLHQT